MSEELHAILAGNSIIIENQKKILANQDIIMAGQEVIKMHQANMEQMLSNFVTMREIVQDFKTKIAAA